jgi:hypothetical protein
LAEEFEDSRTQTTSQKVRLWWVTRDNNLIEVHRVNQADEQIFSELFLFFDQKLLQISQKPVKHFG